MRRTRLTLLIAIAGIATMVVAPVAQGAPTAPTGPVKHHHPKYPGSCKAKFHIAAQQKVDADDLGLYSVVTADAKHSYAVGSSYTANANSVLRYDGLLDEGVGNKWTLEDKPGGVSLHNSFLTDVAASNNHNVWVVGATTSPRKSENIVLHKYKSGWKRVSPDTLGKDTPRAVITRSPHNVYIGAIANNNAPEVFHFNGHKWKSEKFPTLKNYEVTGMAFLGKHPVMVANETITPQGEDVQRSVVLYLSGGQWSPIPFDTATLLTSVSGTSMHDIWASAEDQTLATDTRKVAYHYNGSWTPIYLPDNDMFQISSRSPSSAWFAGYSGENATVNVGDATSESTASIEFAGDDGGYFYAIDAHGKSRVLAVGVTHTNTPDTLIEQAVC